MSVISQVNRCKECNMPITTDHYAEDRSYCRHCYTAKKWGKSDIETCYQGSVIMLED